MRPSSRASRFWRRLAQAYGARLAEQYGATCPPDWCNVIDATDDGRLEQALISIRSKYLQYPPTLGQFEAVIPRRQFGQKESMPERLAVHVVNNINLCRHQLCRPWTYFGKWVDGERDRIPQVSGVVVPGCTTEGCRKFGKPGHRVLETDLG